MQRIEPTAWHDTVRDVMRAGNSSFVTLIGLDDDGLHVLLRLRDVAGGAPADDVVLAVRADDGVDTVTDLLPEAAWYEREAAEMFGIRFNGHDTHPLLLPAGTPPPMRKDAWLEPRQSTPWPGEKDPGGATPRRRTLPPGVQS